MADMATVSWIHTKQVARFGNVVFWNHQWTLTKLNQSDWCPWSKFVPGSQPLFYVRKKTTDNPNQMKQRIKHCHATGKLFYDKHTALLSQLPTVFPSENDRLSMCSTKYSMRLVGTFAANQTMARFPFNLDVSASIDTGETTCISDAHTTHPIMSAWHSSQHTWGIPLPQAKALLLLCHSEWALTIAAEFPLNLKLKVERVIVGGWSAPTVFHHLRSARKASPPPQCPTPPPTTASPIPSPSPIKELEPQNRSGRLLKQISSL